MRYAPWIRVVLVLCGFLSIPSCLPQDILAQSGAKPDRSDQLKSRVYVSDFARMIDSQVQAQLELICKDLEQRRRTQMAIVTVVSLGGSTAKEFATQLANRWRIGDRYKDRGILVLLSRDDKQYRIAVGYGLQAVLNDDIADRLGRQMIPMLRKGESGAALLHVAEGIHDEIIQNVE